MTTDPRRRAAFTLLELMISLALALMIILGINEVFSLTSKTVGAGQVLTTAYQGSRAAQAVVGADFQQAALMSSAPAFIIESTYAYAFRNRADQTADSDGYADTLDGLYNNATLPVAALSSRTHRLDRIGFFARGLFQRQTGTNPAFIDLVKQNSTGNIVPFSSGEAWIVYGQLNLADNNLNANKNTFPGVGTPTKTNSIAPLNPPGAPGSNPNNFYAGQWVQGRSVLVLALNPQGTSPSGGATKFDYIAGQANPDSPDGTLKPLGYGSTGAKDGRIIDLSYHDAAQASIDSFGKTLQTFIGTNPNPTSIPNYWDMLVSSPTQRYVGNPVPAKQFDSGTAAQLVPCFLPGCTHFAVEYTGDFINQNNDPKSPSYGKVNSAGPDGVPDFQIVNGVQQVRWYGLPRSTGNSLTGAITKDADVVPLRDVVGAQPFERVLPASQADPTPGVYGNMRATDRYVVAWGPDTQQTSPPTPTPTMLRFTITLDDMSNRTGAGQTFEYVVQLPQ